MNTVLSTEIQKKRIWEQVPTSFERQEAQSVASVYSTLDRTTHIHPTLSRKRKTAAASLADSNDHVHYPEPGIKRPSPSPTRQTHFDVPQVKQRFDRWLGGQVSCVEHRSGEHLGRRKSEHKFVAQEFSSMKVEVYQ